MNHAPYILGAYGVTLAALIGLGLQAWARGRRARQRLAALEAETPRRRGSRA
ncbi:heme exporter protein CcmD [Acidisoma sp. 7E03]